MRKSSDRNKALEPLLRFPEFHGTGEWKSKRLGEVVNLEYGSSLSESKRREGIFPVVGSNGIVGYHNECLIGGPAIVIGRKGSVGQVNWIDRNCYPIDTTYYVKNKKSDGYLLLFLKNLLERSNLSSLKDQSAVPGLNRENVHSLISSFPKLPEQQKIADCLSSIDELISAETRKLDALKAHKKGLMQQIFPAEGETVPRLRFPEFRDAGEWEIKPLGKISSVVASGDLDANYFSSIKNDKFPHPVYSNAIDEDGIYGYYSISKYPEKSITITARGSLGVAFFRDQRFMGIGRLLVVNGLKMVDPFFLKECWNYMANIPHEVTSIPQLTAVTARSIELPFPSIAEQERITALLSSFDNMVAAQFKKIENLRVHKKGLMHQLFPVMDEIQE